MRAAGNCRPFPWVDSNNRSELPARFVEDVQNPICDRKKGTAKLQRAVTLLAPNARKSPQIGKADLDRGQFHRVLGRATFGPVFLHNRQARVIEQCDPIGNEAAFARLCPMHLAGQRCLAAATHAMAHHHDFFHTQELDRKFERRRNAVMAGCRLEWRDHRCNIADHEDLSWVDIENLSRINPTVRTSDNHDLRRLAIT